MGKYNHLKILAKTKARAEHIYSKCGNEILSNEIYYREHIEDKFLHQLHAKKYCNNCYEKYGDELLVSNKK